MKSKQKKYQKIFKIKIKVTTSSLSRFVNIQQAYEKLSQIKKRRKSRNTVQNNEGERTEF